MLTSSTGREAQAGGGAIPEGSRAYAGTGDKKAVPVLAGLRVAVLVAEGVKAVELSEPRQRLEALGAAFVLVAAQRGGVRSWRHGEWAERVEADVLAGRTVTSWPAMHADVQNAGALWVQRRGVRAGLGHVAHALRPRPVHPGDDRPVRGEPGLGWNRRCGRRRALPSPASPYAGRGITSEAFPAVTAGAGPGGLAEHGAELALVAVAHGERHLGQRHGAFQQELLRAVHTVRRLELVRGQAN